MLSSPDADLVRRDPALPGLGTVLDPARFVAALRAARPELGIEAVQVGYVHYKPGRECIVGYRLPRSERAPEPSDPRALRGTLDLYAVAQRRERWERKHPAAGHAPGDGHRRVSLADEAVTVALFPDDLTLGTLGHLFEADARTRLLRDLLPGRPDLRAGPVGTLAYKPQRRYVGRLLGPDGPLVLKVCAAKDYAATVATAGALGSRGLLRIPRVLGCSDQHRVLAFEWLAGERLSDLVVQRGRTGGEPQRRGRAGRRGARRPPHHPRPARGWSAAPGARGGGATVVRPGGGACAHVSTPGRTGRGPRAPAPHPPPRRPHGGACDPRRLLRQAGPVGRPRGGHHRPRPGGARRSCVRSGAVHRAPRACRSAGRSPGAT